MARQLRRLHGDINRARDVHAKERPAALTQEATMPATDPELQRLMEDLKRQRDELRVRLHLAKAEAKDEWERLEHTWTHVRGKMGVVGREAGKTAADVGAALRLAAEELRQGYQRVRALL
jgi:hypothetical protein